MVWAMRHNAGGWSRGWQAAGLPLALGVVLTWVLMLAMTLCQAATAESNLVAVDFENVDLRIFIKFVSEVTGRVFLLDDHVRGQVSVRFANKIPVDQLADVLESVLEVKGFA